MIYREVVIDPKMIIHKETFPHLNALAFSWLLD
jgi:hypothetical protein